MKKKLISLALVLAMCLSLVACGTANEPNKDTPSPSLSVAPSPHPSENIPNQGEEAILDLSPYFDEETTQTIKAIPGISSLYISTTIFDEACEYKPTAILFFTIDSIETDTDRSMWDDAVYETMGDFEKLITAGGCIEIYEDNDTAIGRNGYLSGYYFFGLRGGKHEAVNNYVVQTSKDLPKEDQETLVSKLSDVLLSLTTSSDETPKPTSEPEPSSTPTSTPTAEVAYSGDLAFYAALPDKSVCEDKIIEVTGEYTDKIVFRYYIGDILGDYHISFTFKERTDAVKQLKKGDIITIRGRCYFSGDEDAQLDDCELISVRKPVPSSDPVTSPSATPTPSNDPQPTDTQTPPENSTFSIHFIDVGQADAALIECDGHYMLIDGGNKADSNTIYSIVRKAGASKLDIVVGTHAHEDHIGGLPGAYKFATVDLTLCPVKSYNSEAFEDFAAIANRTSNGITIPKVGDTYQLGSATVTILGVNSDNGDLNDTSIILMIQYGETSFLFTGDAERTAEQVLLNSGVDLSATVLKVGHHGSDSSTTYPFLREVMPAYAVISVGTGNSYGHPTEDALSRLRDADVKVYRTDLQGDIKCTSDGKTVSFSVSRNPDADVFGEIGSNSTSEPTPSQEVTPQDKTLDEFKPLLASVCSTFESEIFPGSLSYSIISETEVEFAYTIDGLIHEDDVYLLDYIFDEIFVHVVTELLPTDFPETTHIDASVYYDTYTESEPSSSDPMVWIPQSGTKYHSNSSCSNMKNPSQIKKSQAEARGYTACKKCW